MTPRDIIAVAVLAVFAAIGPGSAAWAKDPTTKQKTSVVQAFEQKLINSHDLAAADRLLAKDYRQHSPTGANQPAKNFKGFAAALFKAFPDVRAKYTPMVSSGDLITVVGTVSATHRGAFFGIPPSGKQVRWTEMHIFRIRGNQIAEHWVQADMFGIIQQIQPKPAKK